MVVVVISEGGSGGDGGGAGAGSSAEVLVAVSKAASAGSPIVAVFAFVAVPVPTLESVPNPPPSLGVGESPSLSRLSAASIRAETCLAMVQRVFSSSSTLTSRVAFSANSLLKQLLFEGRGGGWRVGYPTIDTDGARGYAL